MSIKLEDQKAEDTTLNKDIEAQSGLKELDQGVKMEDDSEASGVSAGNTGELVKEEACGTASFEIAETELMGSEEWAADERRWRIG